MGLTTQKINRLSSVALFALSVTAALSVIIGVGITILTGQTSIPAQDEGTGAHIFQLSVVGAVFSSLIFATTADWKFTSRSVQPLITAAILLAVAFGVLYYFEHVLGY